MASLDRHHAVCEAQPVGEDRPGEIPFTGAIDVTVTRGTIASDTGLLLIVHGMGSDYDQFDDLSRRWALRYDMLCLQVRDRHAGPRGLEIPYDFGKYQTVDYLRAVYWALQEFELNRRRVIVWGGSGGGQIALLSLCYAPHLFAGGVALAPIVLPTMPGQMSAPEWQDGWMRRCVPEGPVPADELEVRNPLALCGNIDAPVVLMHGSEDREVAVEHSRLMCKALRRAGGTVTYHEILGGDHQFAGGPAGFESREQATETVADDLLRDTRRPQTPQLSGHVVEVGKSWAVRYEPLPTLVRIGRNPPVD